MSNVITPYAKKLLNSMNGCSRLVGLGDMLYNGLNVQAISVGYAALNTAGTGVAANFGVYIPDNAIIKNAYIEVTQTFADNGTAGNADTSTIKIGIEDQDNDLKAAVSIADAANFWDAGFKALIPDNTAANFVKLTAQRKLAVTWTDGSGDSTALTAGAMTVYIEWVMGA